MRLWKSSIGRTEGFKLLEEFKLHTVPPFPIVQTVGAIQISQISFSPKSLKVFERFGRDIN